MHSFHNFPWEQLLIWYRENGRTHLPWRNYEILEKDTKKLLSTIWLSEILLQQTQAERVIGYLGKIEEKYPTLESLAHTTYEIFFPYYQWLGYYSRARNLLKTAKIVNDEYGWVFPNDESLLRKLPGVWPYTARAILAFWYKVPTLAWDTNLEKVFSRYFYGTKDKKLNAAEKSLIEESMKEYSKIHGNEWVRDINNALMDYARLIETSYPTKGQWKDYPLKDSEFFQAKWRLENNEKKIKQYFPSADAQVVVLIHEDHKKYYSSSKSGEYCPFILPGVWESDTRKYVQSYFKNHFAINLSVRPVHKKWMDQESPYIAVNAQIQSGVLHTTIFQKKDIVDTLAKYKKKGVNPS